MERPMGPVAAAGPDYGKELEALEEKFGADLPGLAEGGADGAAEPGAVQSPEWLGKGQSIMAAEQDL